MVNVVKKAISKDLRRSAWRRFRNVLVGSRSEGSFVDDLRLFLTASEITMLEKRLLIPILLEKKISYRHIGQLIDVSPTTISFVKGEFKEETGGAPRVCPFVRTEGKRSTASAATRRVFPLVPRETEEGTTRIIARVQWAGRSS
ncbi:MAG: Trp family transcriptional regulator [Candidatus Brennerbacteria bacterium]